MAARHKRFDTLLDKRALIAALRECCAEACRAMVHLRPGCDTDKEIHLVTVAIDRLAGHLTGDPEMFHAGGSTGPGGMLNGIAVKH